MARRKQVTAKDLLSAYQQASPAEQETFLRGLADGETKRALLLSILEESPGASGRTFRRMIESLRNGIAEREKYIEEKETAHRKPRKATALRDEEVYRLKGDPKRGIKGVVAKDEVGAKRLKMGLDAYRAAWKRERDRNQESLQQPPWLRAILQQINKSDYEVDT